MQAGTRVEPLRIAGVDVADAICFDVAYDDGIYAQVEAGARLLVVQTSNATFIHTGQIDQQFEITRLRALETGRYVVVASTNGVSGIIAPDGDRRPAPSSGAPRAASSSGCRLTSAVPPGDAARARGSGWPAWSSASCALVLPLLPYRRRAPLRTPEVPDRGPDRRGTPMTDPTRSLGRVVMVVPTYNEADNLDWIVGRLRERPAGRRRAGRRRRLARRHRRDRRPARRGRPPGPGRAPHREGRPGRGVPARLPGRPGRRLRRDRRDGRRRLPPARAAAPAARRAARTPTW